MDVIKTIQTKKGTNITMVRWDCGTYAVQVSDKDKILDEADGYCTLKDTRRIFQIIKREYILKEEFKFDIDKYNKRELMKMAKLIKEGKERIIK